MVQYDLEHGFTGGGTINRPPTASSNTIGNSVLPVDRRSSSQLGELVPQTGLITSPPERVPGSTCSINRHSTAGGEVIAPTQDTERRGKRPRAVIIGANVAGEIIAKELSSARRYTAKSRRATHGHKRALVPANVLGYINESSDERSQLGGLPILGGRSTLRYLVQNSMIDMIIMAVDYKANSGLFQEALDAVGLGITLLPMATVYERYTGKIPVEHLGDQWYASLPSVGGQFIAPLPPLYRGFRKVVDLIFGLLGTLIMSLIFPVLALLIRLDSPGPIFYKQERLGRNGKKFTMLKFRSMSADAEDSGKARWASAKDARVTRIGHFMRATHLDELPQVLNILRGEMSLIGPRPEREAFVSELEKTVPFYRCRMTVKPGLTGWAQVKYGYTRSDQEALEKLQYDLYYIKHQSFMLDIFIILKTIAEVVLHRGA